MKGSTLDHKVIEKDEVKNIWNDVKDIISRTNNDVLNEKDILYYLEEGIYTLWIMTEPDSDNIVTAMILNFGHYPRYKFCMIGPIAGERMSEWIGDLSILEEWAKSQGCHYIDLYGRRGWKKLLKEYKEDCILLRKKL